MAVLTLQPDPTTSLDTYIRSDQATTNYDGTSPMEVRYTGISANTFRSLFEFDLSSIAGATVSAASLTLEKTAGTTTDDLNLCRVTNAAYDPTTCTWNNSNGGAWTSAGGDFTTTDMVTIAAPAATGSFEITGLATLVQDALDNRANRLILILKWAAESGFTAKTFLFDSSDAGSGGVLPLLSVTYTPALTAAGQSRGGRFSPFARRTRP